MKTDIFLTNSYKKALFLRLESLKHKHGRQFTLSGMAEACGVQKTYLSRVMNESAHLAEDQLWDACQYLGLSNAECEFLLLLRRLETCKRKSFEEKITREIEICRSQALQSEKSLSPKTSLPKSQLEVEFFLDPVQIIVHAFFSIPRFAARPNDIAKVLDLSTQRFDFIVNRLLQLGLLSQQSGRYTVSKNVLHLTNSSQATVPHRLQMRTLALSKIASEKPSTYSFSLVFASSRLVADRFRSRFLDLLKEMQPLVVESKEEEVFQLNFDVFSWSEA